MKNTQIKKNEKKMKKHNTYRKKLLRNEKGKTLREKKMKKCKKRLIT